MSFVLALSTRINPTSTRSSSRSTSNTHSSSITATTGTISSSSFSYANTSSSSHANTSSTSSSSSSRKLLSTGARAGLGFGIVFFLLLCVMLFSYLKRRYQRARGRVGYEPTLSVSGGGDFPPPLDVTYPNSQYPISAPTCPSSHYSPAYLIPYETSASATMMTTLNAPAADSSLSIPQPAHQLPALHTNLTRRQDELDWRKRSLDDAQEPHDAPQKFSF
ncbi:hypothetical protein BD769DRAFT_1411500 [Suillus cothurnatus]|nr:hypothetical protein BD769DRAFT_1411500 [Suillus cothurnatus]